MRYLRVTSNGKYVQYNCGMVWQKSVIETTTYFGEVAEKVDNEPRECIFGVCKNI